MRRKPIRIDDIPADGAELPEEQLASLVGGMLPGDGNGKLSSKSLHVNGSADIDQDF